MQVTASVKDWLSQPLEMPTWIVPGLIPAQGFTLLAGAPKSGKSTLAVELASSLASGTPFLSAWTPEKSTRVVYVQADTSLIEWYTQLQAFCPTATFGSIYDLNFGALFTDNAMKIKSALRDMGAEYVIWDSAYKLKDGNTDLNTDTGVTMLLKRLNDIWDGPSMLLHHHRKANINTKRDVIDDAAGHHILTGAAAVIWALDREGKWTVDGRLVPRAEYRLERTLSGRWLYSGTGAKPSNPAGSPSSSGSQGSSAAGVWSQLAGLPASPVDLELSGNG